MVQACAKGHYCPNSSSIQDCPEGFFCKWYSTLPKRCPWLATCPPGSGSADLSLGGFLGLMLILLTLWLAYVALSAYIRSVHSVLSLMSPPRLLRLSKAVI